MITFLLILGLFNLRRQEDEGAYFRKECLQWGHLAVGH